MKIILFELQRDLENYQIAMLFSVANLVLAGIPLTNALGENLPSRH